MTSSVPAANDFSDLALVLSGGGARASYQVGVLRAIGERFPEVRFPIVTGVSAGAINAATIAAHPGSFRVAVDALYREWRGLTPEHVYRISPVSVVRSSVRWVMQTLTGRRAAPAVVRGVMDMTPLREFLETRIDFGGIQRNIDARRLRAVALSATCYGNGKAVTFVQGARDIRMWKRAMRIAVRDPITLDHVMASASIPIIFPAVKLRSGFYGDGSIRRTAPLAPAIHLGAGRLLAISMRSPLPIEGPSVPMGDYPAAAEVMQTLFHSIFLDALDADAERLERLNQILALVPQEQPLPAGLRRVSLFVIRPSRDLGNLARGLDTSLPPLIRFALRSVGGERKRASGLLSYLLFQPEYTDLLMELGYTDAIAHWDEIEQFLSQAPVQSTS